jgi:aerobic carbon-monoxide dehydrogenase small subunit
MDKTITLIVNAKSHRVTTDPERPLLDVLRENLQFTGTKYGCGEGRCGACTVLIEGRRAFSCRTPVGAVDGKSITTIEGLAASFAERVAVSAGGKPNAEGQPPLHPVQEAFLAEGASQCGCCTPGMILTTVALLNDKPNPTDEETIKWMDGNLCRCNNYPKILKAVRRAATEMKNYSSARPATTNPKN